MNVKTNNVDFQYPTQALRYTTLERQTERNTEQQKNIYAEKKKKEIWWYRRDSAMN